jgi:hypothetical protein
MFKKRNDSERKGPVYSVPEPVRADMRDIEKSFTRVFASEDGKRVLAHLQAVTFCRALGGESSEAHLRYTEGQRALVAMMLRMIDRGRMG